MSDKGTSAVLCEGCGEAFTNFLQEMADQNAKVATCPKCGKIHALTPAVAPQRTVAKGQAFRKSSTLKSPALKRTS